jgi:hypothetical protein
MNGILRQAVVSTFAIGALVALAANATAGSWTGSIGLGSWKLDAPQGTRRWLVIRELPSTTDLSFHVEVLQSNVGDPAWKFHKFAVAADADQKITQEYAVVLAQKPEYANRTSYVIAPNGKIIYEYMALNPDKHVENTMAAVEKWKAAQELNHLLGPGRRMPARLSTLRLPATPLRFDREHDAGALRATAVSGPV